MEFEGMNDFLSSAFSSTKTLFTHRMIWRAPHILLFFFFSCVFTDYIQCRYEVRNFFFQIKTYHYHSRVDIHLAGVWYVRHGIYSIYQIHGHISIDRYMSVLSPQMLRDHWVTCRQYKRTKEWKPSYLALSQYRDMNKLRWSLSLN